VPPGTDRLRINPVVDGFRWWWRHDPLGTVLKTSGDITAVLKGKGKKTSGFRDFEKVFSGVSKFLDFAFGVDTVAGDDSRS
jgi:hypothetical protein